MRIIADIKRYRAGPSGKIKRLFRIHRQRRHGTSIKSAGRIIIGSFTQLAVANHDIVGRCDGSRSIASLDLGCRPSVVLVLAKINNAGSTRYSPDIGVEIAGAARDSGIFIVKGFTEDN